jgi:tripartite-type tricarboxylate transporter receptor subunit TctC
MKLARRKFLHLAAGTVALPAVSRVAMAQTYPTRPVRWIVGFGAGGAADTIARIVAQRLSERMGQAFVVENRSGVATNIATEAVARSPPDGYTLLVATSSNTANATLYERLNFNFIRDIAPVARIVSTPGVVVVHPSFPAKTIPDLVAYAKANPGKINMAAVGIGSATHLFGELFKIKAGVDLLTVQYRDPGPAHSDLLARHVDILFVSDFVRGYEASVWEGLAAPRNTPREIIETLNSEINQALADPKIKARFADLGATVFPGSPAEFGKFIAEDTEKWAEVIRMANIKVE